MINCALDTGHICAGTVPIFKSLNYEQLCQVNSLIQKQEYQKGNILFMQGEPANHLYIVRYGRVKLYEATREGRQQIIRILEQGEFFGELSLFKSDYHTLTAETMENTGLCLIHRNDFKKLLQVNCEISLSIMQALSERLAEAESFIVDLTLKNIEERLASWLLHTAVKEGEQTPQGIRISNCLSRQELAQLLGTTIETVSRKITGLQLKNIIATEGQKTIIILDQAKLAALANN